jgi:hypothetical protein
MVVIKILMKNLIVTLALILFAPMAHSIQKSGVYLDQQVTFEEGEVLRLNGAGLRQALWIELYVGSLYLADKNSNVIEILSNSNAYRLQMDFVYHEVTHTQLLKDWRKGFKKNQDEKTIRKLKNQIEKFYSYFNKNAVKGDRYRFDYIPGTGTKIIKNKVLLGIIPSVDFKNILLEIWLGNFPIDSGLKKDLLGL